MKLGEYVKAIVAFQDLIERMPKSPYADEAGLWIGHCYANLKAYSSAVVSYRKALEAASQQVASTLQQIERIRQLEDDPAEMAQSAWTSAWIRGDEKLRIRNTLEKYQEMAHLLSEDRTGSGSSRLRADFKNLSKRFSGTLSDLSLQALQDQRQRLEDLSIQAAIRIAINLVLDKREFGGEELVFD